MFREPNKSDPLSLSLSNPNTLCLLPLSLFLSLSLSLSLSLCFVLIFLKQKQMLDQCAQQIENDWPRYQKRNNWLDHSAQKDFEM